MAERSKVLVHVLSRAKSFEFKSQERKLDNKMTVLAEKQSRQSDKNIRKAGTKKYKIQILLYNNYYSNQNLK